MWLFTRYGFFSIVLARKMAGGLPTSGLDPNTLMIRARKRQHLQELKDRFDELDDFEILKSEDTDYRYRMIVPKTIWVPVAAELASEIYYDNFKSECAKHLPSDRAYQRTLHQTWEIHHGMQAETA